MANRRMFDKDLLQADSFVDMDIEARLLYVYLCLNADDDGFVASPKGVARLAGLPPASIEKLAQGGFIKQFESGVIVIREWWLHNYLKNDRYKPTLHSKEKELLSFDGARYVDFTDVLGHVPSGANPQTRDMEPQRNQDGTQVEPQYRTESEQSQESEAKKRASGSEAQNQQNQAESSEAKRSAGSEPVNQRFATTRDILDGLIKKKMTTSEISELEGWYEELGEKEVMSAIDTMIKSKGKSFSYFRKIITGRMKYSPSQFQKQYPQCYAGRGDYEVTFDMVLDYYQCRFLRRSATVEEYEEIEAFYDRFNHSDIMNTLIQMGEKSDVGGNGLKYLYETLEHKEGDRAKEEGW